MTSLSKRNFCHLNTSVEAARYGEQGKSFKGVGNFVRINGDNRYLELILL